ncbi:sigma-70 family RNA polymerase sigma factor [Micromonospora tulbaghiae]|uniref:sigma-70 family RNA polymerase sigma factor n=1 Tax=Micromonospora tulbaghiae TaxID=479978 RepID=UPI00333058AE
MTPTEDPGQRDLVRRAVAGDPAATEALMAHYRPQLVRYCRARLGQFGGTYTTADDVAQETCIGVLRALPTYRDVGKPFAALVFTIASHKVADAKRAAMRFPYPIDTPPDHPDPDASPEQHALDAEHRAERAALARRVEDLLELLPATHREIITLRISVGLPADQVGSILGMSATAVRTAQSRAVARLREVFASHSNEVAA